MNIIISIVQDIISVELYLIVIYSTCVYVSSPNVLSMNPTFFQRFKCVSNVSLTMERTET